MKCYQEVSLRRDARIALCDFWEWAFQQIHLALVENKAGESESAIGVSFPEYDESEYSLGTRLRLFAADEQTLKQLQCAKWLNRLSGYVHLGGIRDVPENVEGHVCFKQVKPRGSKENLARRRAKRKGESFEQALAHFEGYQIERSRLPYINMHSETNGHRFRLFVEKESAEQARTGTFNCYGLSSRDPDKQASVPWFE